MSLKFLPSLERVPQLELDETRGADGADDLAESDGVFYVVRRGVAKIRMIPDIEEIRRELQRLLLSQAKILNQREITILLKRPPVNIAPEIAEERRTEAGVVLRIASCCRVGRVVRIEQWRCCEVVNIQVSVKSFVNVT